MIFGIGVDLVENKRIENILKKHGTSFLERFFSEHEIIKIEKYEDLRVINCAIRFSAKEAFLKSLGLGLGMGVNLKDIEVDHDENGKPKFILHNTALKEVKNKNIININLSLTHTKIYSIANVILEV